jgi:hypothetical protein
MRNTDNAEAAQRAARFDVAMPHPARMYDYYLGGKDNFAADREAAEQAMSLVPHSREVAWANRQFLVRAVGVMARAGIDQFIDLGTGFPTSPNVHEVAREILPDARIVYVDNDPVVATHNRALLAKDRGVLVVEADICDHQAILQSQAVGALLDFARPVGVLFAAVLHFITDEERPGEIVSAFRWCMAPGSMIAVSHITGDGTPAAVVRRIQEAYRGASAPAVFRSMADIGRFFGDFRLLEPGLVDVADWRPEVTTARVKSTLRFVGGVAQVP